MARLLAFLLLAGCASNRGAVPPPATDDAAADLATMPPAKLDGAVSPPPAAHGPRLLLSVTDLDLGTVAIGASASNVVVAMNTGDAQTGALAVTVAAAVDFHSTTNCNGRRLGPGETCVVTLVFEPQAVGMKSTTGSVGGVGTPAPFTVRGTGRLAPDAGPDLARDALPADGAEDLAPRLDAAPPLDAAPRLDVAPRLDASDAAHG
jgi:hypothetical protein